MVCLIENGIKKGRNVVFGRKNVVPKTDLCQQGKRVVACGMVADYRQRTLDIADALEECYDHLVEHTGFWKRCQNRRLFKRVKVALGQARKSRAWK